MSRAIQANEVKKALKKIEKDFPQYSINEIRIVAALERVIARLERHPRLSQNLVFKGGFVLLKEINSNRFTRDVDALALNIPRDQIPGMIHQSLKVDLFDGFWFGDVTTEDLKNQGPYGGFRFNCAFQIGDPPKETDKIKKLSRLHLDIGFGDAISEMPLKKSMSSILPDNKPVSWSIYPFEYIFAEKLEALFSRGSGSSRAKDIYDMPLIYPQCAKNRLIAAIKSTFEIRETAIPESFENYTRQINTEILKSSWGAVDIPNPNNGFNHYWNAFCDIMISIDKTLIEKN